VIFAHADEFHEGKEFWRQRRFEAERLLGFGVNETEYSGMQGETFVAPGDFLQ
jgi:predicted deacetylase